jgi:hypothetical protein
MADIKDVLKDVLKHTHGLDIFEMVRITGTDKETLIETVDPKKSVVFKGKLSSPAPEFVDQTVGLNRMGILSGFLNYGEFTDCEIKTQQHNGKELLAELGFKSATNTTANYRFMLADIINAQLKDITFKGATFDVDFEPSVKSVQDLVYFNSILGSFESTFSPRTEDGNLYFYIGDQGGDRSKILIAENVKGKLPHNNHWPLAIILKILKLGGNSSVTMSISNAGILKLVVDSGIGEYTYLLPKHG